MCALAHAQDQIMLHIQQSGSTSEFSTLSFDTWNFIS
jgi:hypothetical protein